MLVGAPPGPSGTDGGVVATGMSGLAIGCWAESERGVDGADDGGAKIL